MRTAQLLGLSTLLACFVAARADAADVSVKGVHICCGSCVDAINAALGEVKGVTDIAGDQNTKVVSFKAADEKTAKAGLEALAKAGFHGTATVDKKEAAFPGTDAKKGTKAKSITLTGVHLCCGACVTAVKTALKDVKGVDKMDIDKEAKTVSASGADIDEAELVEALNKGGFHGELKKAAKP